MARGDDRSVGVSLRSCIANQETSRVKRQMERTASRLRLLSMPAASHRSRQPDLHRRSTCHSIEKGQGFRGLICLILNQHATSLDDLPDLTYTAFVQALRGNGTTFSIHINVVSPADSYTRCTSSNLIPPARRSSSSYGHFRVTP